MQLHISFLHCVYVWEEKYILIIFIFYFRLGGACSHVAALLFKLQTCTLLELNKVASTSKLCAWNKSRKQVETAPLVNISFNRSKGHELVPNVLPNNIDELRPFCTVDPVRNSNCTPEPFGSLFEPRTINFDKQKFKRSYIITWSIITIYAIKQRKRVYQMPGKFTELVE